MYGLNAGTKIAQFTLEQQLGQGGQGSVWRARAPSGPPVALKIIPVRGTPTTMVERVRREAEALMRLSQGQPSVVACLGVYEDPTLGVLAVAMELVDGVELQAALRDPRCDGPAREAILMHVARALGHLHDNSFVHRDIKPQNILVKHSFFGAQHDPSGVKLVDFGIATPKGNPKPLTEVGTVIGTPAYMPPERIDPIFWQAAQGLPCEDVFALGVVAYETLFGRHPAGVEDDGTLSVYAERYRAVSRSGEVWPALPPDHRWTGALRGSLALKVSDRLADGNAVARAVSSPGATASDPGLRQPPRTEIGMPLPVLPVDGFVPPGQTQAGAVYGGAAPAGGFGGTAPAGYGGTAPSSPGWPGAQPQAGWPPGPGASPAAPLVAPMGVPPAPAYTPRGRSSGGGNSALRFVLGGVGVLLIGIPAVVLAARFAGRDNSDSTPIVAPSDPPPTVPTTTTTAGPSPTDTVPPPLPTFTATAPIPTQTTPPPSYPTAKPTTTATAPGTGKTPPPSTTSTGNGTPPKIGPGTQPTSTSLPGQPNGRPPAITIGRPGGNPGGNPGGTPGGTTSTPPGGRPPGGPIRIGK